jgi:hypothetical protein
LVRQSADIRKDERLVAANPEDEGHRDWLQYDFGQATAYMMLTATDLGIGSGHSAEPFDEVVHWDHW